MSHTSRRKSLKSSALATTVLASGTISACSNKTVSEKLKDPEFPLFLGKNFTPKDGIAGLLFSQVGYELGLPVRVVVRLPKKEHLATKAICRLIPTGKEQAYELSVQYWGDLWKSHWWVAEINSINETGEWNLEIVSEGRVVFKDKGLEVGENVLWNKTYEYSSVDMLERRKHFTNVGAGWQDAGALWVESPAQSAMIIALTELLDRSPEPLEQAYKDRIYEQLVVGCDYHVLTQNKALELGFPKGAISHDLFGQEKDILPHDAAKAVVALYRTIAKLPKKYIAKKEQYQNTADMALNWLVTEAKPMGDKGMSKRQRGLSEDAFIPKDEWMTRDLVTMTWAFLEKFKLGDESAKEQIFHYAAKVMLRQIPESKAENRYYGHFYEYTSTTHSEKSWCHGIVNKEFGADMGGIYPNYLMPLVEMLALFPQHEEAEKWKKTLQDFANGYLIPACTKNPFLIVPLGIFGDEGPIWFAGPFHGSNTIYGYTAALALELSNLLDEPKLKEIAYSNLLWLAGLNAGITKNSLKESVIYSTDVPEGAALPASMICNVGKRWAGTWFNTRGVICNGFSAGGQFKFDIDPTRENDGPNSFTDEDWIPHSAGWLTGLIRLKNKKV